MALTDNNLLESLDWENFNFPLLLTNITLKNKYYNLRSDCKIEIWRNDEYKLCGKIKGYIHNKNDLAYNNGLSLKKGAFIRGDVIYCQSNEGDNFILLECIISRPILSLGKEGELTQFEAHLKLDSINKTNSLENHISTIIDWHICSSPKISFPRTTKRYRDVYPYKFRLGIDTPPENIDSLVGFTRDFIILQIPSLVIIIQSIHKTILPNWSGGLAIEYRSDIGKRLPDPKLRQGIMEFIGFIFGIQLLNIGSTHLNSNKEPIVSICSSPWGNNVISNCSSVPLPPIEFGRDNFERELSLLLEKYLLQRDRFNLRDVLWKLWLGKDQDLGTNLPIFASGIESLAVKYIEEKQLIKKYSKTEKVAYRNLIKDEEESLSLKLKDYQFLF